MGRILFLIIAAIGVVLIARFLLSRRKPKPGKPMFAATVRCAHCGTHLPRDQAISRGDRYYCNVKHLSADEGNTD